jgi:hypothetical protein
MISASRIKFLFMLYMLYMFGSIGVPVLVGDPRVVLNDYLSYDDNTKTDETYKRTFYKISI